MSSATAIITSTAWPDYLNTNRTTFLPRTPTSTSTARGRCGSRSATDGLRLAHSQGRASPPARIPIGRRSGHSSLRHRGRQQAHDDGAHRARTAGAAWGHIAPRLTSAAAAFLRVGNLRLKPKRSWVGALLPLHNPIILRIRRVGGLAGRPVWLSAALSVAAYLASIAVTSTSIAILGHANWLTTRDVEAGIGALPKASARHFSAS